MGYKSSWNSKSKKLIVQTLLSKSPYCLYCRKLLQNGDITIDHIIPLSKGGTDELSNLRLACYKCNNDRGNLDFSDYISKIKGVLS